MRYIINGRNVEVTEGLRTAITDKIGKLDKYFHNETEAYVTLSVEKERHKVEVTIPMKGNTLRAEETNSDMYVSIDLVQETLERQLKRYKNKITDRKHSAEGFAPEYIEKDYDEDDSIKIEKSKRFAVKPMDPEEACLQMELLGHSFFVFRNSETDEINVVYKRKGNTYGIIEPEY